MYKFIGKKGQLYKFDPDEIILKLNANCSKDEKNGTGPGSCGYKKDTVSKSDTEKKDISTQMDNNLIKDKIINGKPLTQKEKDFVKSKLVNDTKSSIEKPPKKEIVTKDTAKISFGKGLTKIKEEIKKAGGPEAFFKTADTHSKGQEERKPIDSKQASKIISLYTTKDTFKTPYKEENGVKWYKQDNKDTSIIVAKIGKKVAAYAIKAADSDDPENPYTTIVASTDFKGKGIGKQAMMEFYDNYPEMIKKTGGLTPMGKQAYLKTLKKIAGENDQKQNMTLDGFSTTKDLDLQLESILKSIEPEVMAAIEKIAPKTSKAQP